MKTFKLHGLLDLALIVHGGVKAKTLKDAKVKFKKLFKGKVTSIRGEL